MLDAALDALDALDADAIRAWSSTAVDLLAERRAEIDALNVFPVADSDTGSNVLATVRAGADALAAAPATTAAAALRALAGGAAASAAGNSGFLVSQLLRGLADAADTHAGPFGADTLAAGLRLGADLARAAVVQPVEGTILTVATAAAGAADEALATTGDGADPALSDVLLATVAAADHAVQQTPGQLSALSDAGVVDAGGCALLVLLDALVRVVTGRPADLSPVPRPLRRPHHLVPPDGPDAPAFEVQYRLAATDAAVEQLRAALARLGDSVVVVGAGESGTWNVHAHVRDVGAAIEAGVEAGRLSGILVTRFGDDAALAAAAAPAVPASAAAPAAPSTRTPGQTAVLAIAAGPGLASLFHAAGASVVEGGGDDLPSRADIDAAIAEASRRHRCDIVLLPNAERVSADVQAAADLARRDGLRVAVVPTRSPVQALAAVAVHDPGRRFDDDVVAMAEAAAACRHAELSVAPARALTAVGICQPGDVLGLIDGEVVEIGRGLAAVAFNVVDRLLGVGAELMTVLVGSDAPVNIGLLVEAHVRGRSPFTDVSVYAGGRLDHLVIIGVE